MQSVIKIKSEKAFPSLCEDLIPLGFGFGFSGCSFLHADATV